MELTVSTHLWVHHGLEADALAAFEGCGFCGSEVWLAEPHVPWRNERALGVFRRKLEDAGIQAGTVHLPFYPSVPALKEHGHKWSVLDDARSDRRDAIEGAAEGLRAAAALGADAGVLHLGWPHDSWQGDQPQWAREAVAELLPVARACGVQLLLENIISTGTRCAELVKLLDEVDSAAEAGICLDLGHAHVLGGVVEELEAALPRLAHLHVHDNDGQEDSHLAPGRGTIPWREVLTRLQSIGYSGRGALELRDFSKGKDAPGELVRAEVNAALHFQKHWQAEGLLP